MKLKRRHIEFNTALISRLEMGYFEPVCLHESDISATKFRILHLKLEPFQSYVYLTEIKQQNYQKSHICFFTDPFN